MHSFSGTKENFKSKQQENDKMGLFCYKEFKLTEYLRNGSLVYDDIDDEEPSPREEILNYKPATLDSRQDDFNVIPKPSILS